MDHAKLIEAAIENETRARDTAAPEDRHFWGGWTPEAVRAGYLRASVFTSAPGQGHTVIVTRVLMVCSDAGEGLATVPDTQAVERVNARVIHRAGGLEAYARKVATSAYGAGVPVKVRHYA